MLRAALSVATCLLLAGCDGGLHMKGIVYDAAGHPAADVPVYFYLNDAVDKYDPVLWTDQQGRFELNRLDCPCDFQITLVATRNGVGPAVLTTTHKAIEKNDTLLELRMQPAATRDRTTTQ